MITTDSIRRLLAIADVARDPYAVSGAAAALLSADPSDRFAAEHYFRALAALKLTGALGRFTGNGGDGIAGGGGGGGIAWSSRARRFAANLRALEARTPVGATLVAAAAAELPRYELHQAADGNFQVLDTHERHPASAWLGGLAPHKAATALLQYDRADTPMPRPLAFDGVGFGWVLTHFLEITANSYLDYNCPAYVLEGDPLALAMLLHMHDLQAAIASPRTRWFVEASPEAALAAFKETLERTPGWTLPDRFLRCALRPRPPLDLQGVLQGLHAARDRRQADLVADNARYYADKERGYWQARFAEALAPGAPPEKRLRVLGITSRYTTVLRHSMAELQAAVHASVPGALAHMEIAIEPDDQSLEIPFVERIHDVRPDLIVALSRMRYENPHLPGTVPFLAWDQDNLFCMRTPEATASLSDGSPTFVAGNGAIFGYGHLGWPERACIFCHAAGATFRYADTPVAPDQLAPYACDISYVSNASDPPEAMATEMLATYRKAPPWGEVFDAAAREVHARAQAGVSWDDVSLKALVQDTILRLAPARAAEAPLHELIMDLHRYADRCFRHATLAWVSRWCAAQGKIFRLYGRGWERHPEFARWASGPAEPGEQMRAIYQASRINLQLIESGFIHSRSLDGLAARGFFLTRLTPADGIDAPTLRDIHLLGRWVVENDIHAPETLLATADPVNLARWKATLAHHPWTPAHAIRVLRVWADTPPPIVAFPMLPEISFRDAAGFARLAERYLANGELRAATTRQMRQIVLQQFSYTSRWKHFLTHIARGLATD
jgi:hypothetical protein